MLSRAHRCVSCWIQVNVETHPRFKVNPSATGNVPKTNTVELINQLFEEVGRRDYLARSMKLTRQNQLSENNCLVLPASYFSAPHQLPAGVKQTTDLLPPLDDRGNFFRATFAGSRETIKAALAIFGRVMKQSWGV